MDSALNHKVYKAVKTVRRSGQSVKNMLAQQLSEGSSQVLRTLSFSKEIVGKNVLDVAGFNAGRVRDLVVRLTDEGVKVIGAVVNNRFVPWSSVKSFGADLYLNARWFAVGPQPVPGDSMLVCQHMLGEQLLDAHGRHAGHVDDIGMTWDASAHELKFDHILTGPYLSIGMDKGSKRIPWSNVMGMKSKPRALVIRHG